MLRKIFVQVNELLDNGLGFDFGNDSWVAGTCRVSYDLCKRVLTLDCCEGWGSSANRMLRHLKPWQVHVWHHHRRRHLLRTVLRALVEREAKVVDGFDFPTIVLVQGGEEHFVGMIFLLLLAIPGI